MTMVPAWRPKSGVSTKLRAGGWVRYQLSSNGTPRFRRWMYCSTKRPRLRACRRPNMRELAALQARFGSALDAQDAGADALEIFIGGAAQIRNRFGIYRGNTQANAAKAIEAAYPVVAKIVGTEFFTGLAAQYRSRFPSRDGDLNEYGESFADFLADFQPA